MALNDYTYYLAEGADPLIFAYVVTKWSGCICEPDVSQEADEVTVLHDEDCPMAHAEEPYDQEADDV